MSDNKYKSPAKRSCKVENDSENSDIVNDNLDIDKNSLEQKNLIKKDKKRNETLY